MGKRSGIELGSRYERLKLVQKRCFEYILKEVPQECFYDAFASPDGISVFGDEDTDRAFAKRLADEFSERVNTRIRAKFNAISKKYKLKKRILKVEKRIIASRQPKSLLGGKQRPAAITDATPGTAMSNMAISQKLRRNEKLRADIDQREKQRRVEEAKIREITSELASTVQQIQASAASLRSRS